MARGVQNVHALAGVVELQHRGGDGNTTLLLDVHPVGNSVLGTLLALDGTGLVDGSAVQQQLFGQRGLAGVGMADDRKRPAALDFFTICHRSEILLEGGEVFSAPAARERRKHIFTHTHFILYENAR